VPTFELRAVIFKDLCLAAPSNPRKSVKDLELLDVAPSPDADPAERGFADVWKKSYFAWDH
jgi:hypothetical protein